MAAPKDKKPSAFDSVNVPEAIGTGLIAGGLYWGLLYDGEEIAGMPAYIPVGLATAVASAVSDYLATIASVQSALGDLFKTYLKAALTGASVAVIVALSGGDIGSLENIAMTFGFGFASKLLGDMAAEMYEKRMNDKSGGKDNSGTNSTGKWNIAYM
jgi:hypothetical protein